MTSTHVTGVVRFGDIDWRALGANVHPVDLILDRGFSVYCGVDRNLFMVVKYHHQIASAPNPNRDPFLAPPPVEFPYIGLDDELNLLRLDDATLEDLRMLGVAKVRDFISGGLAFCRVPQPDKGTSPTPMFKEVVFDKCHLFDKAHWTEVRRSRLHVLRPWDLPQQVTDILLENVYLEAGDVASIPEIAAAPLIEIIAETSGSPSTNFGSEKAWEEYPLEAKGHPLPPHLLWLYRGALAIRDGTLEGSKGAITDWLETVPPRGTFGRVLGTAVNLLNPDYRYAEALNDNALGQLPKAVELEALGYLGPYMRSALCAHHYWNESDNGTLQARRARLASKLLGLGFQKTAIGHLVQMISGRSLKDAARAKMLATISQEAKNLAIAHIRDAQAATNMPMLDRARAQSRGSVVARLNADEQDTDGVAVKSFGPTF